MMNEGDETSDLDETPQLSGSALDALNDFYREKDVRDKNFEDLKAQAEQGFDESLSIETFTEDWNASQFWYDDQTADILSHALLEGITEDSRIAIVSAPSVFIKLKKILASTSELPHPRVSLLEYDERFSVFKEFVSYDFAQPIRLPEALKGQFDRVICDPPFLSSECQTKVALTARWLAKSWQPSDAGDDHVEQRFIVCTGERMEDLILKLYGKLGMRTTSFMPKHAKGLSNEFRCYANFEADSWRDKS